MRASVLRMGRKLKYGKVWYAKAQGSNRISEGYSRTARLSRSVGLLVWRSLLSRKWNDMHASMYVYMYVCIHICKLYDSVPIFVEEMMFTIDFKCWIHMYIYTCIHIPNIRLSIRLIAWLQRCMCVCACEAHHFTEEANLSLTLTFTLIYMKPHQITLCLNSVASKPYPKTVLRRGAATTNLHLTPDWEIQADLGGKETLLVAGLVLRNKRLH